MKPIRRRYRIGIPGLMYIGIMLLMGIGALNSDNNLLFLAFGISAAAMIVSGLVSGSMMMGIRAVRVTPEAGAVDQPLAITYELENRNRFVPAFGMTIDEFPSPIKGQRPRWRELITAPRLFVMHTGAGETVRTRASVTPRRRGQCQLVGVRITSTFPFGIFKKSVIFAQAGSFDIHPRVDGIRSEVLRAVLARGDIGVNASKRRGSGDEFYGLREYRSGDAMRHIAWKSSARIGEIMIREHLTAIGGTLWIVLDLTPVHRAGSGPDDLNELAITLAASFAVEAMARGSEVGLCAPSENLVRTPSTGTRNRLGLLSSLARIEPGTTSHEIQIDEQTLGQLVGRAPCVVIHAGDLDPAVGPSGARHITASEFEAVVRDAPTIITSAGSTGIRSREQTP